jgi:hypothetical protein
MLRLRLAVMLVMVALLGTGWVAGQDKKSDEKTEKKKKGDKNETKKTAPVRIKGYLPAGYGKLGLSTEQKQKIYKVRNSYNAKIADLRRQIEQLRKEQREETEKVLTPEQLKRLRDRR